MRVLFRSKKSSENDFKEKACSEPASPWQLSYLRRAFATTTGPSSASDFQILQRSRSPSRATVVMVAGADCSCCGWAIRDELSHSRTSRPVELGPVVQPGHLVPHLRSSTRALTMVFCSGGFRAKPISFSVIESPHESFVDHQRRNPTQPNNPAIRLYRVEIP